MKSLKNTAVASIAALALLLTLSSCGTAGGLFHRQTTYEVPATSNGTNTWLAFADYQSAVAAAALIYSNTPPAQVLKTNQSFTVAPAVTGAIDTVHGITGALPQPYGGAVDTALGLGVAVLGWIARIKTKQATTAQNAADTADENRQQSDALAALRASILRAVTVGVELGGDSKTKQSILAAANAAGIHDELNDYVHSVTGELRANRVSSMPDVQAVAQQAAQNAIASITQK